jgi:hypothetical protein
VLDCYPHLHACSLFLSLLNRHLPSETTAGVACSTAVFHGSLCLSPACSRTPLNPQLTMFVLKLILRLWLVGVHFGLWGDMAQLLGMQQPRHLNSTAAAQANSAAAAPVVGIAARQGRRFSMEDRAVYETAVLGPTMGCAAVNYTYAAGEPGPCHSQGPLRLRLQISHMFGTRSFIAAYSSQELTHQMHVVPLPGLLPRHESCAAVLPRVQGCRVDSTVLVRSSAMCVHSAGLSS